jgi:hypothetical protein
MSPRLEAAVYWALEKDPSKRPNARELRKALKEIGEGASPVIPRATSGITGPIQIPEGSRDVPTEAVPLPFDAILTPLPSMPPSLATGDLMAAVSEAVESVANEDASTAPRWETRTRTRWTILACCRRRAAT